MIEYVNIRATALSEFWGTSYNENIYLWEGAKHKLNLKEIDRIKEKTCNDQFSSQSSIDEAMLACKALYFNYLPILTKQLNQYHKVNLSTSFWQLAFGYWFYRHICVVYEKYAYLSKVNIDKSSIKLLNKQSYYIPFDHDEYYEFFGNDFGVQQLVSEYYYLFANNKFEQIDIKYNKPIFDKSKVVNSKKAGLKRFINFKAPSKIKLLLKNTLKPKIVLVDAYYTMNHIIKLIVKSRGKILPIDIPKVENNTISYDRNSRETIFQLESNDPFEKFLIKSFAYSVPTIFIENFKNYYNTYLADIKESNFNHIVSEGCFGISNVALYCALANEYNRTFIFQEHASSSSIVDRSFQWFYLGFAHSLITTGWKSKEKNVIQGGFLAKNPKRYSYTKKASTILFVGHTVTPYLMEFSWHPYNSNFLDELYIVQKVFNLIPSSLIKHFKFRPRRSNSNWDTEITLDLAKNNERVDRDNFHVSIYNSKIIILDHLSTAIAELLIIWVPFLILINRHTKFTAEAQPFIDEMAKCGVIHYNPERLVSKLVEVYDNTEEWWRSTEVKNSVSNFRLSFLGEPSNTYNFLTSLIKN